MGKQYLLVAAVAVALLFCWADAASQPLQRKSFITYTTEKPKIDGVLQDAVWSKAEPLTDFRQWKPNRLEKACLPTEVRLLYDNSSIYVFARLRDSTASKIAKQLGARDSYDTPYCDIFSVGFSPYNDGVTSYYFAVSAAGVQSDRKVTGSTEDGGWNAVWYSAVKVDDDGWCVEMEIPLTQLRFSSTKAEWGFNSWRLVKRLNEWDAFNPVDVNVAGINNQEASLSGFEQLKMPFRLSLSPYLSYSHERSPKGTDNSYKGGLDLRYGISDGFTLDMMVIPDFSQVRADDIQLNLSTVEQQFSENRQFFTEGSELFSRGGIFYSRRIGGVPLFLSKAYEGVKANEIVADIPATTSMINATKVSGRTKGGLGVGFLNAVTSDAYATIRDTVTGITRDVNVQPLSNYNVVVVDVPAGNGSYVSAINASMVVSNIRFTFNNTAVDFYLTNKKQSYALKGNVQYAMQVDSGKVGNGGLAYSFSALKTSGNFRFELSNTLYQDSYNPTYMGYIEQNNRIISYGQVEYLSYDQKERSKFRRFAVNATYERVYNPSAYSRFEFNVVGGITYNNEFHHQLEASVTPCAKYDYFEPRHVGYKYAEPKAMALCYTFNTDIRKRLSITKGFFGYWKAEKYNKSSLFLQLYPSVRFSNSFSTSVGFSASYNRNAIGYAEDDALLAGVPVFGRRNIDNYEQSLELSYIVSKNAFVNVRGRYNWTSVHYRQFYHLKNDGWADGIPFLEGRDINYTAAIMEANIAWNFAPGSQMSFMYRKNFDETKNAGQVKYFENWRNLTAMPQRDLLSFRFLYYWEYRKR